MKDNEKKGSVSKNRQEISVKEDPKLRKLKELPSEVLAAAIRDAMHKGKKWDT